MKNKLVTEEQFKDNPFIFVQLEESIKITRKMINQLELDIIICEEGRTKKLLEEKLTNAKKEIDQLIGSSMTNSNYASDAEQNLELLSLAHIKEALKNNQEKLSLEYARYYHYVLGINVDPLQTLVSEVHRNIPQIYMNQLEYLTIESFKEHIKDYKDYLMNIRKPFSEATDNEEIDRYLELITYIGSEITRCRVYIEGYENRIKNRENIVGVELI